MVSVMTGVIGAIVAIVIVLLIRRDRLHVSLGIGWIFVAICFSLLGLAPSAIDYVAQQLGFSYPPILAVTLGLVVLVIKILLMDIERSKIEIRYQRLVQRVAMLEADLQSNLGGDR